MPDQDLTLSISVKGDVSSASRQRAEEKLGHLIDYVREPVLFGEIRLAHEAGPGRERPAVAEATIDLNGTPIRAQVAGPDIDAAVDLLEERLRRRISRHEDRLHRTGKERQHRAVHEPGDGHEWRHGDLPTDRPEWFDRPIEERDLIRHKTFALTPLTVDEAGFDLDALAHDFYLFTEIETDADTVISFDDDRGLVVQQLEGIEPVPTEGHASPIRILPPAPELTQPAATERLDIGGERFVFFRDADTGRGHVVYHRYDGHYGLITPAT